MRAIFQSRRFLLFASIAICAAILGFWVIPPAQCIELVKRGAFWVTLLTFCLFLWNVAKLLRWRWRAIIEDQWDWAVVGICGALLLAHEPFGFKILMDEVVLNGAAMSLHFDKIFAVPFRGHDLQGAFLLLEGYVDKRPVFFPFLLSLFHDFTGYRPENAFVLNGCLTFAYLGLCYLTGKVIHGRFAGLVFVALQTGLPLLGQNCTGGGFELLNLVMILGTLLLGILWLKERTETSLSAFLLSFVLLAQTRYESALFALPVGFLVLWGWIKSGRAILSTEAFLVPMLLITYPLQNKVFSLNETTWELAGNPGHEQVFSFHYIPHNVVRALSFFFDGTRLQSNSIVLSALGILAVPFFVILTARRMRRPEAFSPGEITLTAFVAALLLSLLLLMTYFWGQFDDPVIRRLSLPTYLLFTLATVIVLPEFVRTARGWKIACALSFAALLLYSVPVMASHAYSDDYLAGQETQWRREFMRQHPERDYLMVDNESILWIINQVSSTPINQAKARKDSLVFHFKNHSWNGMYVFQRIVVDPDTGAETVRAEDQLGSDFQLETIVERRLKMLTLSRISRIVDIRSTQGSTKELMETKALPPKHPVLENSEKIKQAYWENWLKNLP